MIFRFKKDPSRHMCLDCYKASEKTSYDYPKTNTVFKICLECGLIEKFIRQNKIEILDLRYISSLNKKCLNKIKSWLKEDKEFFAEVEDGIIKRSI